MENFIIKILSNFGFATLFAVGVLIYIYRNSPNFLKEWSRFNLNLSDLSHSVNRNVIVTDKNTDIISKQYNKIGIILKDIEEFKVLINDFKGDLKKQDTLIQEMFKNHNTLEKTLDEKSDSIIETQLKLLGTLEKLEIRITNLEKER